MKQIFTLALTLLLALASCRTTRPMADITGEWNVVRLNGETISPNEDTPFLGFDLEKGQIYGFTGCNRLTGSIDVQKLSSGKADFSQMGCTRMLCADDRYEVLLLSALAKVRTSQVSADTLTFYNGFGKEIITLKKR